MLPAINERVYHLYHKKRYQVHLVNFPLLATSSGDRPQLFPLIFVTLRPGVSVLVGIYKYGKDGIGQRSGQG